MTLPAVIRIFFAIDLPPFAKEKIGGFIVALKKKAKSNAIRWSKPDNLHITLQFLAEVRSEHLPRLIDSVRTEMKGIATSKRITFGSLHVFPNPYRPRVIVLDITPQEALAELSAIIGQGITKADYAIENRPFKAHLTLGRIKNPQHIDLSFLSQPPALIVDPLDVQEVVLFRSEPQPEGSTYTVIETFKREDTSALSQSLG